MHLTWWKSSHLQGTCQTSTVTHAKQFKHTCLKSTLCCPDKGGKNNPKPLVYELSTQSQNEPVIYKCKLNLLWVKKPGKKGMVAWSLGCSCLPHQYNLSSLCQTRPSSITFRQQFTLFPCFPLPAPLVLLDPFLNLPAQKLAVFSKKSKHCWEETSLSPSNFSSVPPSPAHAHLSPSSPPPKRVFASQKNH